MDLSLAETIADHSARMNRSVLAPLIDAETQPHLPNPNMAKLVALAQHINSTPQIAAEAVRAIRDRIDNKEPKVRLLTLMCLDALIRNCTPVFHAEVAASRPLLHDIIAISTCGAQIATPEHPVQQYALQLILNCNHWFRPDARQGDERLKPLADLADVVRRTQCTLFHGMDPDVRATILRRDMQAQPVWQPAAGPVRYSPGNSWTTPPGQPSASQYPAIPAQSFIAQPYPTGVVVQGHPPYSPHSSANTIQTGVVDCPPLRTVRTPPPVLTSSPVPAMAAHVPMVVLIPPTEQQIGEMTESLSLMSEMLNEVQRDPNQRRSSAVDEVLQSVADQVGSQHTRLSSFIAASGGAPLANGDVLRSIASSQSEVLAKYRSARASTGGTPPPEPRAERGAESTAQPPRVGEGRSLVPQEPARDVHIVAATSPRDSEDNSSRAASPGSPPNPSERLPFAHAASAEQQRRTASYGTL